MKFLSESLTTRIKEQVKDQLPQILPKEVSNFAPPVIEELIKESHDEVTLAKVSSQPHSTYEAASTLTDEAAKTKTKMKTLSMDKTEEEPVFEVADSDMPQDQEGNMGDNEDEPRKETASRHDWLKKPTPPQEPTDPDCTLIDFSGYIVDGLKIKNLTQEILLGPTFRLLKGTRSNYAELEYDFEECYKALSEKLDWENPEGGVSNMTYTTSATKTKAAQYDLPGIEYMVPNIWSSVKVAYDRYALWGISHWREQRNIDTGYLEEIVVRKADNVLYRFKKGDDVADFVIALRMFTRSLVIQKRVEDLQLGVESYQKKINVTKPDTTRPDLKKRHPYTPYKDPQGFIYVDDYKRNRLMRSDELYKFSGDTLTILLSLLEDITKNIDMEYLPKRRRSTLEKKRVHFMIKDINKLLKERRIMRSLEKFVSDKLYRTDLRLLQRTI
ncbi:hypothetical protein Tco_0111504 [Tanacetum coccineum]